MTNSIILLQHTVRHCTNYFVVGFLILQGKGENYITLQKLKYLHQKQNFKGKFLSAF